MRGDDSGSRDNEKGYRGFEETHSLSHHVRKAAQALMKWGVS